MTREEIVKHLINYLLETNPLVKTRDDIPLDQSLYELGVLDSFGIVEMVTFIESKWGIEIPRSDLTRERFGGINKMTNVILDRIGKKEDSIGKA